MKIKIVLILFALITTLTTAQWIEQQPKLRSIILKSITFSNQSNGLIVGTKGTILHSSNSGESWDSIYSPISVDLEKVFFIDDLTGWIVGDSGKVIGTKDGGLNWSVLASGINEKFYSVHFFDMSIGWIVGKNVIYKTTDSGNSWVEKKRDNNIYYDVYFSNQTNGWVVGDSAAYGIILKTTNGGETWAKIYDTYFGYLSSICFASPNSAFAAGENSIVPKSTDGGITWFDIIAISQGSYDWQDVYFINENNGWLVDLFGAVANTTDGGLTWTEQIPKFIIPSGYFSIFFSDSLRGWAVGAGEDPSLYGRIIRTVNGGVTGIENEIISPAEFLLSQNYPNPFNPVTTIKYSIPSITLSGVEGSRVTLKVFDVLGNEIATLVNEEKPAGIYEVLFDAAGLASGVYFYSLTAGGFYQVKKMVYLR